MAIKFLNNVAVDSDVLYVDTINNRVGIGTTSPQGLLHISSDSTPTLIIGTKTANQANSGAISFREIESTSEVELRYNGADNAFKIWTSLAGDALTVLRSNANVGIGTTSPLAKLDVNGNFRINTNNLSLVNTPSWGVPTQNIIGADDNTNGATLTLMNTSSIIPAGGVSGTLQFVALDDARSAGGSGYATATISALSTSAPGSGNGGGGNLIFKTANSYANVAERMRISPSGSVGIGTTSPDSKLEVASTSSSPTYIHVRNDSTGSTRLKMSNSSDINSNGFQIINNSSNGQVNLLNYKASTLALWTNALQRVAINSSGNVSVGTDTTSAKLEVRQDANNGNTGAFTNTHVKLTASATADNTGFVGITAATSTSDNYGYSFGAQRTSGGVGSFKINYHNNSAAGTNRFIIDQNGNVGIGTTSPVNKLNVVGDIGYTGVIGQGSIYGNPANSSYATMQLYNSSTGYTTLNNQSFGYYFNTGGGNKLTILNSGNVGIGTTSPSQKLEVDGNIYAKSSNYCEVGVDQTDSAAIRMGVSSGGVNTFIDAYNTGAGHAGGTPNIRLLFNTSEKFRFTGGGNFGIGTTSPSYKLHVAGNSFIDATSASAALTLGRYSGNPTIKAGTDDGGYVIIDSSGGMAALNWYSSNNVALANGGGNVGIGTTSPSQKLDVVGSIEVSDGIYIGGTAAANKLDDYEEGTFDLEWGYARFGTLLFYDLSDFGGNKSETSRYVKVGRHVTVTSIFRYGSLPTAWTDINALVYLKLPFTVSQGYYGNGAYYAFPGSASAGSPSLFPASYSSASSLLGMHRNTVGSYNTFQTLTVGQMPGIGPSGYAEFRISFSFYTTD